MPTQSKTTRPWPAASQAARPVVVERRKRVAQMVIPEWRLQAAAVGELRRALDVYRREGLPVPFLFAGDMNAARRSIKEAGEAKATGLEAGEPDMRFWLPDGAVRTIELKAARGVLSEAQRERHKEMAALGHPVITVHASTEEEARDRVVALVDAWTWASTPGGAVSAVKARMVARRGSAANDNEPGRQT